VSPFRKLMYMCVLFDRHELPVSAEPIEIIADTDELLVVNKPSSIPIHPCGRYRFNSLVFILAKEKGFRNLRGKYSFMAVWLVLMLFDIFGTLDQEFVSIGVLPHRNIYGFGVTKCLVA